MKHKMTVEEDDLRDYVAKFLALHGVQSEDEIQFLNGEGEPVSGLHIDIDCILAPIPDACPLCGRTDAAPAPSPSETSPPKSNGTPKERVYDASKNDMTDSSDEPSEEGVMSMAAIRAANNRLTRERQKEAPRPIAFMPGESDEPPGPGE